MNYQALFSIKIQQNFTKPSSAAVVIGFYSELGTYRFCNQTVGMYLLGLEIKLFECI